MPERGFITRCGFTVLYVEDLERMTAFYAESLGLPIAARSAGFVAFDGAGAPLALETGGPPASGPRGRDRNPTFFQFIVHDLDAAVAELTARGVSIEGETKRGSFGALAAVRDPEGNRVGLLEPAFQRRGAPARSTFPRRG